MQLTEQPKRIIIIIITTTLLLLCNTHNDLYNALGAEALQ